MKDKEVRLKLEIIIAAIVFAGVTMLNKSNNRKSVASNVTINLQSVKNIAEILGIAAVTSTGMYLYYRKKQKKSISPLPVLYREEKNQ